MSRRTRRSLLPAFKAKVALAAMKDDATPAELGKRLDLHDNQIAQWKEQRVASAANAFGDEGKIAVHCGRREDAAREDRQADVRERFLEGALIKVGLLSAKRLSTTAVYCP